MESRTQFTFYASIFASACRIKNKAARADFYDAICTYALTGTEPDLDKLSDAAAVGFISAKPNLDASRKKAKSGKAGGSAKQTASKPQANGKQTESKTANGASEKEVENEKENEIENEVEVEIENECYLSSTATAAEDNAAAAAKASFDLFWEQYPNKVGRSEALSAWLAIFPSPAGAVLQDGERPDPHRANLPPAFTRGVAEGRGETDLLTQILAGLDRWKSSIEWQKADGRYIPRPENWLTGTRWLEYPQEAIPQGASGQLGQAELEAIQRMMRED